MADIGAGEIAGENKVRPDAAQAWQLLRVELAREALSRPWPEALAAIGALHMVACVACHMLYCYVTLEAWPYLLVWSIQLALNLVVLRRLLGKGWVKSTPLVGVLARVWATFLIISFSVTSYSEISSGQANAFNWFKPAWCSLSCFAWAVTAWLANGWFVLAAVWTWAMGWAMIFRIQDAYLIYGAGWAVLLWIIAGVLRREQRKLS